MFFKKSNAKAIVRNPEEDVLTKTRNWYHDYYAGVVVQRNILLLLNILMVAVVLASVFSVNYVMDMRTIQPFVVQVESSTGITSIVDPISASTAINGDDAIDEYFIVMYLRARETYDNANYEYNYQTITKLLSNSSVYSDLRRFISDPKQSPINRYSGNTNTTLEIRSIQLLKPGEQAQIRFRLVEHGASSKTIDRIATLNYGFYPMELSAEQRFINPLGFQVTNYRVDDEFSG